MPSDLLLAHGTQRRRQVANKNKWLPDCKSPCMQRLIANGGTNGAAMVCCNSDCLSVVLFRHCFIHSWMHVCSSIRDVSNSIVADTRVC